MAKKVNGIIVEIGGDTSKLQEALKKVNSSTSSLSRELKGINSLLKLDPKNMELASQKQTVLKNEIEETEKKLKLLHSTYQRAVEAEVDGAKISEENWRDIQREIILTENKLKELQLENSKWTQSGRTIEEFGNKVTNISSKVDKIGTTLTTRLTLPIVGLATATVNSAKEFETAFTGVEKTVDGTAEQMANLKQGIKDMSEVIPASTTEISAVAEAAGQLGIETDNVLDFTKTMINMGNATNLSAEEAATTLARFANITRMSQSDFDRLGSVIVALGNNFQTTEAEISAMGMNLASAGTQIGMSQSEIMALATALSSVGLEAQAGGTAFSKVMVNMQLAVEKGGKELKDFASVAGMSTKQFKKAFKEDATSAIMQFVDGLSKSGERGKSAIKILDDMGITETRLRDALLRSANASEVMSKAIDLGNKAWEENVALTNEANKRYETTESRMEMTKNKILNVATNTGNKLTPTFNKLLDKVDGLADKFNGLNEEETKNVIKTLAIVAAIGPAIKILGTLGSTTGKVIKGVGTLSQAVGVFTSSAKSANATANALATGMSLMTNPIGATVLALGAVTTAMIVFSEKETEEQKRIKEFSNEMSNQRQALEEYNRSIDDTTQAELSHIDSVERLKEELNTLVDENGNVKEGYESRVSFILNELNKALGTEYDLNGNVIESYQNIQEEIDNLIKKKKAEIEINAKEQKYKKAIEDEEGALNDLNTAYDNLGMSIEDARAKRDEIYNNDYDEFLDMVVNKEYESLNERIKAYEDAEYRVKDSVEKQKDYQEGYALFIEGKYDDIRTTIKDTTKDWCDSSIQEIEKSISEQSKNLSNYKDMYTRTGNEIALRRSEQAKVNLENLRNELIQRTQTVGSLGQDEINAWKTLAESSYGEYSIGISQMAPEMQQKIQEATGVIAAGTPQMQAQAGELGQKTVNEFDKSSDARQKALNTITGYLNGLDDNTKREMLRQAGIEDVDIVLDELNKGNLSEEHGRNLLEGLWKGLKDNTWTGRILGVASGLAQAVNNAFTGKQGWDEHSPSKKMQKYAELYIQPISDVMKNQQRSIVSNAQRLANSMNSVFDNVLDIPQVKDFGKFQGSLNRQISGVVNNKTNNNSIVVQFYPQQMTETEMDRAMTYLNKKFGKYM